MSQKQKHKSPGRYSFTETTPDGVLQADEEEFEFSDEEEDLAVLLRLLDRVGDDSSYPPPKRDTDPEIATTISDADIEAMQQLDDLPEPEPTGEEDERVIDTRSMPTIPAIPMSMPPPINSLPPPAVSPEQLVALPPGEEPWLDDPRLAPMRAMLGDQRLIMIHKWGIDPTWATSQIVGYVHVHLLHKADRKVFEKLLPKCIGKDDLLNLVSATLEAEDKRREVEKEAKDRGRAAYSSRKENEA